MGRPMASLEVVSIISLPVKDNPDCINVTLRGLSQRGLQMRKIKIISGRWYQAGQREVVAGKVGSEKSPDRYGRFGLEIWERPCGKWLALWMAAGSATDSEVFDDVNQAAADFNRPDNLSSALVQATDEVTAQAFDEVACIGPPPEMWT